jgi:predicted NUDIX family NTP pyrophosphohydrolase
MWANRTLLQEKWPQLEGQAGTSKSSAGLLMYRRVEGDVQLFLVHPSGPYLRNQDLGTWTIPKGEIKPDEAVLSAACRRFTEDIGLPAFGPFIPLKPVRDRSGNLVHGWAFEAASDAATQAEEMQISAADRAEWLTPQAARFRIDPAQSFWIDELVVQLRASS